MAIDFQVFNQWVKEVKVGKKLPDAIYTHESALDAYPEKLRTLVLNIGKKLKIDEQGWNIIKLFRKDFKIAYLHYPEYDTYAYPSLKHRITVDLTHFSHRKANYGDSANPPILHRKETFVFDDYALINEFKAITKEGEDIGLYENPKTIGFKKQWERLISTKGYQLDDKGRLQLKGEGINLSSEFDGEIERHKTAIDRFQLSSPMQVLARHGYFDLDYSLLDYGCGKGDDIRELEAHGVDCIGWDPIYQPDKLFLSQLLTLQ